MRYPPFSLFLAVAIIVFLAACSSPQEREAAYLENGKSLMKKGELAKASLEFRNALQVNPAGIEAKYFIGLILEEQGNIPAAVSAFQEVAFADPTHRDALLRLGKFALMAANPDNALMRAEKLIELDGNRADALTIKAAALLMKGQLEPARVAARAALTSKPNDEDALIVLASESARQGDLAAALRVVDGGLRSMPRSTQLLGFKLKVLHDQGDIKQADAVLRQLATVEPANIRYIAPLAAHLVAAGDLPAAQALFRNAIAVSTDAEQIVAVYADFLQQTVEPQQAIDETKALADKYPEDPRYRFLLAQLYLKLNRFDEARGQLNSLVATLSTTSEKLDARTELARTSLLQGDKDSALTQLGAILEEDSHNHGALLLRAAVLLDDSQFDASLADARAVLRDVPNSTIALAILGRIYVAVNEKELAIGTLRTLAALDRGNIDARLQLAGLLATTSPSEALQYLDAAILLAPDRPAYSVRKAQLLIYSKKWDQGEVIGRALLASPATMASGHEIIGEAAFARKDFRGAVTAFNLAMDAGGDFSIIGPKLMNAYAAIENTGPSTAGGPPDDPAAAEVMLRERILKNPQDSDALTLLASRRQAGGDVRGAEQLLRQAIATNVNNRMAYLSLALLLKTEMDYLAAAEVLDEAGSHFPNDRIIQESAAIGNELATQYDSARARYVQVLNKWPDSMVAANNLPALIADVWPDDKVALETARNSLEKYRNSGNAILIDTLGWVHLRLGNIDEAVYLLGKAAALETDDPQILYHYALALSQKGLSEKAKATIHQALLDKPNFRGLAEAEALAETMR
ncbi:MAG: tetratricopeptide repeat protein [Rhodospirillaceae bacterium]|nr:tetratricopeptide repeat protein [Rhodospirillaceae bacterium]